jgi:RNA-directed DNA polymerase
MPKTELLEKLADVNNLYKAWRIVHTSVANSKSERIRKLSSEFSKNPIKDLERISFDLRSRSFDFGGVVATPIKKNSGKSKRPVGVSEKINARIVQRAILNILWDNSKIKDLIIQDGRNSFGGIENTSTRDAIEELCKNCIEKEYYYFISSDIHNFFQNIINTNVHRRIIRRLPDKSINSLIKDAVKCEIVNMHKLNEEEINMYPKDEVGVIQGSCLSPLYGNIFLSDFDQKINSYKDIRCIRYIDDFIIIGKSEKKVKWAFDRAIQILKKKGLSAYTPDEENTKAVSGDVRITPIELLGCSISKGQVRPQRKARQQLIRKIDEHIKVSLVKMNKIDGEQNFDCNFYATIAKINNIIKGWGGAFSFCNSKGFFIDLDNEIADRLTQYQKKVDNICTGKTPKQKQRLYGYNLLLDCTHKNPIY